MFDTISAEGQSMVPLHHCHSSSILIHLHRVYHNEWASVEFSLNYEEMELFIMLALPVP
jgi:hypothetical protein